MRLRNYWTLSKRDGRPEQARQGEWINGTQLPPDFIQGLASEKELMDSSWLLGVLSSPASHGAPDQWDVVEIQGDEEQAIVARKPRKLEGVFVKGYNELRRVPLVQWIEAARTSDDDDLRQCAEKNVITMEIAAEGYD